MICLLIENSFSLRMEESDVLLEVCVWGLTLSYREIQLFHL